MPDPVNSDNSFATGVDATHIGPETGGSGKATAGGASGAGVHGDVSPAPAAGVGGALERDEPLERMEERSFDPAHTAAAAQRDMVDMSDTPEALKRATDGDEQKSKPID